jgi:hypothetical protein
MLKSLIAEYIVGGGVITLTRATTQTVINNDGYLVTTLAGEIAQKGGRRICNQFSNSQNLAGQTLLGATAGTDVILAPDGTMTGDKLQETSGGTVHSGYNLVTLTAGQWVYSVHAQPGERGWMFLQLGLLTGYFDLTNHVAGTLAAGTTASVDVDENGWYRYSISGTEVAAARAIGAYCATSDGGTSYSGTTGYGIYLWGEQLENVTAQTTKTAGEYVSVGVLSDPWHNAGVDGVKWFDTDISGNPIPAATLDGIDIWSAATEYLGVTATPATQTTASLGTGTYTLWCEGTGSCIASAGTATITGEAAASAGAPDQFEVTVAGTVTVTVTGSLTTFNLTNTAYQHPYIANTGAAGTSATRNAGVLSAPTAGNILAAAGTIYLEFTPGHAPSGIVYLFGSYVDANNGTYILHDASNLIFRQRIAGANTDATIANAFVSGTTYKMAARYGSSGQAIALNGTLGTPHANTTAAQIAATMQLGGDGNGGNQAGMAFKLFTISSRQFSDSELIELTL